MSGGRWCLGAIPPAGEGLEWLAPAAAALALAVCLLGAAVIFLLRRGRRNRAACRWTDPETGLATEERLKQVIRDAIAPGDLPRYYMVHFYLNLPHVERLGGPGAALAFLGYAAQRMEACAAGALVGRAVGGGILAFKRGEDVGVVEAWVDGVVEELRRFSCAGGSLPPSDIGAGIFPLSEGNGSLEDAVFHARQCAQDGCRGNRPWKLCESKSCLHCHEERQLLTELEQGLAQGQLPTYIQFFVDAKSRRVVGGEALSRWEHPQKGLLTPGLYVPLLEREDRISTLDRYCLERACAFLQKLCRKGTRDFVLTCNCSRKTMARKGFVEVVAETVARFQVPPKMLCLELTESCWVGEDDKGQLLVNIREMRKTGVGLLLDDFGAGFASFHDLLEYPVDGLKVDKGLVDAMFTREGDAVVSGLVRTGHQLGLPVLAEGVEEERQADHLREMGCDMFQGFLFSRPVPEEEAFRQLARLGPGGRLPGQGV